MPLLAERIINEHEQIAVMQKALQEIPADNLVARETQYENLQVKLRAHMEAEEETIYRVLRNTRLAPLVEQALDEHEEVRKILYRCDQLPFDYERWCLHLQRLKEVFDRHIFYEEENVLRKMSEVLDDSQIESLAAEFDFIQHAFAAPAEEMTT
jgi:hemerythrin superfamily protein